MALYYDLPVYRDTYKLILKIFECTKVGGFSVVAWMQRSRIRVLQSQRALDPTAFYPRNIS